jgi:hypothetical protein
VVNESKTRKIALPRRDMPSFLKQNIITRSASVAAAEPGTAA